MSLTVEPPLDPILAGRHDGVAAPAIGDGGRSRLARRASAWRVPLAAVALVLLPWVLPSWALAINVLIYGLYAVGFNLLFGYTGLLSFGHAAFFGAGAYVTGIAIAQYGWPWYAAMAAGVAGAGLLALVMGTLSIRTRGIYFSMVTLALCQLVYYTALQASDLTGGENGLRGFTVASIQPFGWTIDILDPAKKYYAIAMVVVVALWIVSRLLQSGFGAVIEAVRENEGRARACGFDVEATKLKAFVLSGLLCGVAGTLSAIHLSIVPLDILSYQTSGLAVMMALLGGAGSFFGPFVGAFAILAMENVLSLWSDHWQLVVGAVFVLFVLFLPGGVWGAILKRAGLR